VPFAKVALSFDSPEYFSIVLFGFTSVVALGGGSLANAFISLFLGMLVSTVGVDETTASIGSRSAATSCATASATCR
jgi:putative tricarboxylic transport membrane protein